MPVISIIVPVYNMENTLESCIVSILAQTYNDYELLLINDGSTDRSGEICDKFALSDARIHTFYKTNGGVASAKNYGISVAQGTYITFVDSDDYIDADYLEVLINSCDFADFRIAGLRYLNEKTLKCTKELQLTKQVFFRNEFRDYIYTLLDSRGLNYHVAKLYKRDIIEKNSIRFTDFRDSGGDDTIFNFDYLKYSNSVVVSDRNIYNYILYASSTSHRYTGDKWKRSKTLDRFLRNATNKMGLADKNMQYVLDKRIVFSALWSAEEILNAKQLSHLKKKKCFSEISKDRQFVSSAENVIDIVKQNKGILFLYQNNWIAFYCHEKEIVLRIKAFIYRTLRLSKKEVP